MKTVTFQFGADTGYGRTVIADQSPVTGSTDTAWQIPHGICDKGYGGPVYPDTP